MENIKFIPLEILCIDAMQDDIGYVRGLYV